MSEKYSSYIGNYIVENMVPTEQKNFTYFRKKINIYKYQFGVPLIKDCNHEFLIRYFESWNKPNFELNPKGSIFQDFNSPYPKYNFSLFFAQVIYRIHQKDEKYNFDITEWDLSLEKIKTIRKELMSLSMFCVTKPEQKKIVDYFLT